MVCVGIDVAKDKHDCCILDSDGTVRADCFNSRQATTSSPPDYDF